MLTDDQMPEHLQSVCDEVIAAFKANKPIPDSLNAITDWLTDDGWDALIVDLGDQMAVSLRAFADLQFDDRELRACEDIPEDLPITDKDRLQWGRSHINSIINDYDEYWMPSVHTYELTSTEQETAVIGCLVKIHGQSGPVCNWQGLWESRDAFWAALGENNEFWVTPLMGDVPDEVILSLWQKPKRAKKATSKVKQPKT